jgi:hypothetical protein
VLMILLPGCPAQLSNSSRRNALEIQRSIGG